MDASLRNEGPQYTLRFERRLAHSPKKVWRVLTEREALKQWFPCDVVGEWTVGAKLQLIWREDEVVDEVYLHGEVLAVEPFRLLEYRWGETFLRFELVAEGDGCRLIFSESFEDRSIAARNAAGWETCLTSLESLLEGRPPEAFSMKVWRVHFERYVSNFEPLVGAQQGPPDPA